MDLDASIVTAVLDIKLLMDGGGSLCFAAYWNLQASQLRHQLLENDTSKAFSMFEATCKDKSALEMRNTNRSSSNLSIMSIFH